MDRVGRKKGSQSQRQEGVKCGAWQRHLPRARGLTVPRVLGPEQGQKTGSRHGKRAEIEQRKGRWVQEREREKRHSHK